MLVQLLLRETGQELSSFEISNICLYICIRTSSYFLQILDLEPHSWSPCLPWLLHHLTKQLFKLPLLSVSRWHLAVSMSCAQLRHLADINSHVRYIVIQIHHSSCLVMATWSDICRMSRILQIYMCKDSLNELKMLLAYFFFFAIFEEHWTKKVSAIASKFQTWSLHEMRIVYIPCRLRPGRCPGADNFDKL